MPLYSQLLWLCERGTSVRLARLFSYEAESMFSARVIDRIAKEVSATADQVSKTIALLNSGNTIPFIARYRKDATGGLDDARLESIESRNHYFTALEQRRKAVLENIEKLGKLSDSLRAAIEAAMDKNELEDLYLPFK